MSKRNRDDQADEGVSIPFYKPEDLAEERLAKIEAEVRNYLNSIDGVHVGEIHYPSEDEPVMFSGDGTPISLATLREAGLEVTPEQQMQELLDAALLPSELAMLTGSPVIAAGFQVHHALYLRGHPKLQSDEAAQAALVLHAVRWYEEFRICRSAAGRTKGGEATASYDHDVIRSEASKLGWTSGTPVPRGLLGRLQKALASHADFASVPDRSTLSRILRRG